MTGKARHWAQGLGLGSPGAMVWKVSQFTYFQQVGGHRLPSCNRRVDLTGLSVLAMYVLGVDHVGWTCSTAPTRRSALTYGDVFKADRRKNTPLELLMSPKPDVLLKSTLFEAETVQGDPCA